MTLRVNGKNTDLKLRTKMFAVLLMAVTLSVGAAPRLVAQEGQPAATQSGEGSTPVGAVPEKKEEVHDENDEYRHSDMVQKLGRMVGLNTEQAATAFTVFNFAVLAIAVGFGLLKALPKTFRNRSTAIQKKLVDARTATEEARARLNSVEARLAKLDEQIAGMHKQAEQEAVQEEQRIKATVEEQRKKILADADAEISAATAAARRDIQKYAAELAIEQAAKKLVVTQATDRLLVENFAQRLGASGDKGGQN